MKKEGKRDLKGDKKKRKNPEDAGKTKWKRRRFQEKEKER